GGAYAIVDFQVLAPFWNNNAAYTFGDGDFTGQKDLRFNMQFVPKITLGFNSCNGLGFRTYWWGMAVGAKDLSNFPTGTGTDTDRISQHPLGLGFDDVEQGDDFLVKAHLAMNVWNVEVTDRVEVGLWDLLVAGGLRYAHVAQRYDAFDAFGDFLQSGHN